MSRRSEPSRDPALAAPAAPLRYGLLTRLVDRLAGRRDAATDAAMLLACADPRCASEDAHSASATLCATQWISRNAHTYLERDCREWLGAEVTATPLLVRLRESVAATAAAEDAYEATGQRRSATATPLESAALRTRGPAEQRDAEVVVMTRRRREHARLVAQADAATAEAGHRVESLRGERAQLEVRLQSLFDVTRDRTLRLRELHLRRVATYRRAYRRRINRRLGDHLHLPAVDVDADVVPVPAWTNGPCPWTATTHTVVMQGV